MALQNLSRAQRRHAALVMPIGRLAGWLLLSGCQSCRVRRYMRVAALVERYGRQHQLGAVLTRLRCRRCGQYPDTLQLLNRREDGEGPPLRGVILYGPGAF